MTYHPPFHPTPGRFVSFHHGTDGVSWPALILEVNLHSALGEIAGSVRMGGTWVDAHPSVPLLTRDGETKLVFDPAQHDIPDGWAWRCLLQVFRPRANEWPRSSEGIAPGCWSWPQPAPPKAEFPHPTLFEKASV